MTPTDSFEELWRSLEAESAAASRRVGWFRRLIEGKFPVSVHVAVQAGTSTRSFMLDVPLSVCDGLRDLPETVSLSITIQTLAGLPSNMRALVLELGDSEFADLFDVFCTDYTSRLPKCVRPADAIALLLERLSRWQRFLSVAREGLSQSEVIGLVGELAFLRDVLIPIGGIGMVRAWTGASNSAHDFVVPAVCSVEVKTTASSSLKYAHIHGENQLDAGNLSRLFLVCYRLDMSSNSSETICSLIADIRAQTRDIPEFASVFNQLLVDAGYLDRHADRYLRHKFRLVERRDFIVSADFPRIVGDTLPDGVDKVSYRLDLRHCTSFECLSEKLEQLLSSLSLNEGAFQ